MMLRRIQSSNQDGVSGRRFRPAFTLVELLVVIAIIGLLVAILVPSLSGASTQAKIVATQAMIKSLDTGLETFKQESALGGIYPPSAPDDIANPGRIADPIVSIGSPGDLDHTTGASLLVYALNGADELGTPGFSDRDNDGIWANDFGFDPSDPTTPPIGAHATDSVTREPLVPRYGPYAGTLTKDIRSVAELYDRNKIEDPGWDTPTDLADGEGDYKHRMFVDRWGYPVLYYHARSAAKAIVPITGTMVGVYTPSDNAYITGGEEADGTTIDDNEYFRLDGKPGDHVLANVRAQQGTALEPGDPPGYLDESSADFKSEYLNSFERFIWDDKSTARIAPVNRRTYLLISAGPDSIYGTGDDVTNFVRK